MHLLRQNGNKGFEKCPRIAAGVTIYIPIRLLSRSFISILLMGFRSWRKKRKGGIRMKSLMFGLSLREKDDNDVKQRMGIRRKINFRQFLRNACHKYRGYYNKRGKIVGSNRSLKWRWAITRIILWLNLASVYTCIHLPMCRKVLHSFRNFIEYE